MPMPKKLKTYLISYIQGVSLMEYEKNNGRFSDDVQYMEIINNAAFRLRDLLVKEYGAEMAINQYLPG